MNQHPPYKRIVVTGLGVISPNGEGKNAFTQAIHQGIPGTRPIQSFECNGLKSRVAGEIPHFKPPPCVRERDLHRLSRCALLAIAAGKEALEDAGLQVDEMPMEERQSFGVVLGTGGGSVDFIESQYTHYFSGQLKRASAFNISASTMGTLSSELSITFGLHGLSHVVTTGCTSSTDAIGHAADLIRMGRATRILTGGADAAITHSTMTGFCIMGVVSTHFNETPERASRPFNKDRDGFVLGEGAWMIMLERLDAALERGARIYAELLGYGSTCDAYHTVRLDPEAREPARAMQLALEESALAIDEIGYVNLHGTSTQLNDRIETIAMRRFLNSRAIRFR